MAALTNWIERESRMKAAYYESVGRASDVLHLGDVPTPQPVFGEVQVQMRWSGVNPSDCKSRAGLRSRVMPFPRVIPHSDGMGVVTAVGEGVSRDRIGQRVWLWNAAWGRAHGTACEYVCLPQNQAVRLPDEVADEIGACLGIPALTAMHAVLVDGGVAGQTVLVSGGAGAVGHYAIQMASQLGAARIIATVSTQDKARLARDAGADEIIFYKTEPLVERLAEITSGAGVDRVIEMDMAANGGANAQVLRTGGVCVGYGSGMANFELPFFPLITKNLQFKFFIVYNLGEQERKRAVSTLTGMLTRGRLQHNIATRLSLERVAQAHEMVETGQAIGNVVLAVS